MIEQKACVNDPDGENGSQGGRTDCKSEAEINALMSDQDFMIEILFLYEEFDRTLSYLISFF